MTDNQPNTDTRVAVEGQSTALSRPILGLPTPEEIRVIEYLGKTYKESGLLPKGVTNWQAAVISIQAGRELGIPPTVAIREIYVVNGRPTCSAQLMMSLIRRTYGGQAIRVKEAATDHCTVEYREPGWDGVSSLTFTIEDAKTAGLAGKDTWKQYPRSMLRNRAVSEVARLAFPDCINGMYTPEEMNAPVDEEGRIVVTGTVVDIGTGEVIDPPETVAMRRLHAIADEAGVTHKELHTWAIEAMKVESLADLPVSKINGIAEKLRNPEVVPEFRKKYGTSEPSKNPDDAIVDAEYTEVDTTPASLFDGDDLAQLNADADRVQRREAATR